MIALSKKLLSAVYFLIFLTTLIVAVWYTYFLEDGNRRGGGIKGTSSIMNYVIADYPEISSIMLSPFANFETQTSETGTGGTSSNKGAGTGKDKKKAVAVFGVIPPDVALINFGGTIKVAKSGEETPLGILGEVNESGIWIGQTFYEYKR